MIYIVRLFLLIMILLWTAPFSLAETTAHHAAVSHTKKSHHSKKVVKHHAHGKKHTAKAKGKQHHKTHLKKSKPKKHRNAQVYDDSPADKIDDNDNIVESKNMTPVTVTPDAVSPDTVSPGTFSSSLTKHLVEFVHKTVNTFHYSVYKLGGKHFDTQKGVYIVDCSSFVDNVLQKTCPKAFSSLVDATGADAPASQHYYNFFTELSYDPDHYWNKVENVEELKPGDILVIRYKNLRGAETGGHVMVVMNKPERDTDVFYVRVADSAPTRHSEDTRELNTSGIGIGTLLLKANTKTGQPMAYAWGIGGYWNKNANFAMARPVDTKDLS
jgi:hypothetical protein